MDRVRGRARARMTMRMRGERGRGKGLGRYLGGGQRRGPNLTDLWNTG